MWFFLMLILVVFLVVFILFFYRSKDLVINQKGIYTGRAGQFHWKEIEKAEIKDMVNLFFKKEKCIVFDLGMNMYEAPMLADWMVYSLPASEVAVCESDTKIPLEKLLKQVQERIQP